MGRPHIAHKLFSCERNSFVVAGSELFRYPGSNFEPIVLMLILGALLCLRYWHLSTKSLWQTAAFGLLVIGMWVDWAMYIFVVVLCTWWFLNSNATLRRFARAVLFAALISGFLYLISIRLLRH